MIKHSTNTINISPADDIFNDENKAVYTILKEMLLNTNKKITEIAQLSGYSDIKYFNLIFKNYLGMTPEA